MNIGFWEIFTLAVLALLIFGPEKLPEISRNVGKTVATFRREARSTLDELKRSGDFEGVTEVASELRGARAELKGASAELLKARGELKAASKLTGPMAAGAGAVAAGAVAAGPAPGAPPPFDPDAT